ncbi:hypothetical protein SAMN05192575_101398 [Nocardioides alpinus]|uniref:Surface-anchored protein n=1 Tax=Nocardioides alpinus TaxID=748909 RepID=A0A1I0VR48_9ACTN|nr:hypothetical protein [Nocardioides alpinus]PKH37422.1 hypothetical protein CXG46_18395 [Nocardioides alpinus]SFA78812.1 hypothetical protein SAMN05192575_101398 [Nocardioides alpinus]
MRITRLVAGTVTAGLLGVTPIAISAPAHADGQTYTPTVTAELNVTDSPYEAPFMYGGGFYVTGTVTDPNGLYDNGNPAGVAYLQVYTASNPVWTTIATDAFPSTLFFDGDFTFSENAQYKVVFSGAPARSGVEDTLLPAESVAIAAPVTRKVVFSNPRGTLIKGKVTPNYGKKKIKVQKRVGKKWKKFNTYKTTSAGKYRFTLPAPRRGKTQFKISVPGNAQYTTWETTGYTYSSRTAVAPRAAFTR